MRALRARRQSATMAAMTKDKKAIPSRDAGAREAELERKSRQAAALRANLRRRKEQRRGRDAEASQPAAPPPEERR